MSPPGAPTSSEAIGVGRLRSSKAPWAIKRCLSGNAGWSGKTTSVTVRTLTREARPSSMIAARGATR
eukprot:6827560-Pyramimonas_sp.AAC.1